MPQRAVRAPVRHGAASLRVDVGACTARTRRRLTERARSPMMCGAESRRARRPALHTAAPCDQVGLCLTPQARSKRKIKPSSPSGDGKQRVRLTSCTTLLERNTLGSVPRSYDGLNSLALLLSERHPSAVMCARPRLMTAQLHQPSSVSLVCCFVLRAHRPKQQHFVVAPSPTSPIDVHDVHVPDQWETPWEVVEFVRTRWAIQFDACASPFNTLAPRYATAADDILTLELRELVVFVNPPYHMDLHAPGCAAIGPILCKLVDYDVRERGCTLVALLPVLSHHAWFQTRVLGMGGDRGCDQIHWISPLLRWNNIFHRTPQTSPYIYPFILAVWYPGAPRAALVNHPLKLIAPARDHHSRSFHLRRCKLCQRVRVLPRYIDPGSVPLDEFSCSQSPDMRYNTCESPEYMFHLKKKS